MAMAVDEPNGGEVHSYGEIMGITGARSLRSASDPTAVAYWNAQSTTIGKKATAKGPPSKPPNGEGKGIDWQKTATQVREFARPSLPVQKGIARSEDDKNSAARAGGYDSSSSTDSDIRRSRNYSNIRGGQRGDFSFPDSSQRLSRRRGAAQRARRTTA